MTYDVADVAVLAATFTVDGVATDPTLTTCTVRKPDDTTATPAVTNPSTGSFLAEIAIDQPGWWHYRFVGTGLAAGAEEGSFYVRTSQVL